MPALSETQQAAIRACVALLEALDPEGAAGACRDLKQVALECAMEHAGVPLGERRDAGALIDFFELRKGETT